MTNKPSGQRHLERFPTHVPGLDTILGGGLFAGGVYFVQGAPGVGKTTLANQICFRHVASGGRAVYATLLTESHDRLLQHLRRQSFFAADAIATSLFYVSAFRHLENAGLKGLVELIQREVTTRQATLLVLDGLMLAVESVDSDRELRLFVHEVQTLATMIGCTVLLLTSGSRTVPRAEQTMVEGILELEDRLVGSRSERQIQIRKFRGGRVERGTHAFCITDDGIEIYPRLESRIDRGGPPVASAGEPLATGGPPRSMRDSSRG
ncbi:MAG TPA: ATPase domain-containing protein [Burkholderiaceae bacterium]|nr:ATPase domain-containing protein [Burkholderiaceae bacterium]